MTAAATSAARINALAFEIDAEANLLALQAELREHTYRPGTSICFVTGGPKPREVFAADFRDRVVHHLLVRDQEPVFEPRFIHDSYACRRGKRHAGGERPADGLPAPGHRQRPPAGLGAEARRGELLPLHPQGDPVRDHRTARSPDPELLWLTRTVLFHDPTGDYRFCARAAAPPPPAAAGYPIPAQRACSARTTTAACRSAT